MSIVVTERLVQRWEDRRYLKNLMGKYVTSVLLKRERTMYDTFWAKRDDICLGVNHGWYAGPEAVQSYYQGKDRHNCAVRDRLMELYPEQVQGRTAEELYGIGILEDRTITNCVLEIAADRQTAKGMWCEFASVTDVTTKGPVSNWVMGYYAADFILEDDTWKLWHLQHLTLVDSPCSKDWSLPNPYPDLPEFAALAEDTMPAPNVPAELSRSYSAHQPMVKSPRIPEPYDTFAETFSYGM